MTIHQIILFHLQRLGKLIMVDLVNLKQILLMQVITQLNLLAFKMEPFQTAP